MNMITAPIASASSEVVYRVVLAEVKGACVARASFSRRELAQPIRLGIDMHIAEGEMVELDCASAEATQSFMDELVGILVLERGPKVLNQLRFRGCSQDMKAIINFVVSDRAAQFMKHPHLHAPR